MYRYTISTMNTSTKHVGDWLNEAVQSGKPDAYLSYAVLNGRITRNKKKKLLRIANVLLESDLYKEQKEFAEKQTLRPWQMQVNDIVKSVASDTDVHWIYDKEGNSGKSWYANWAKSMWPYGVHTSNNEWPSRLLSRISKYTNINAVIIDIPKDTKKCLSYSTIDNIKSMRRCTLDLEAGGSRIKNIHVICFSNAMPYMDALSDFKWKIHKLDTTGGQTTMELMSVSEARDLLASSQIIKDKDQRRKHK